MAASKTVQGVIWIGIAVILGACVLEFSRQVEVRSVSKSVRACAAASLLSSVRCVAVLVGPDREQLRREAGPDSSNCSVNVIRACCAIEQRMLLLQLQVQVWSVSLI